MFGHLINVQRIKQLDIPSSCLVVVCVYACVYIRILPFKSRSHNFFFTDINTFIQQQCIK